MNEDTQPERLRALLFPFIEGEVRRKGYVTPDDLLFCLALGKQGESLDAGGRLALREGIEAALAELWMRPLLWRLRWKTGTCPACRGTLLFQSGAPAGEISCPACAATSAPGAWQWGNAYTLRPPEEAPQSASVGVGEAPLEERLNERLQLLAGAIAQLRQQQAGSLLQQLVEALFALLAEAHGGAGDGAVGEEREHTPGAQLAIAALAAAAGSGVTPRVRAIGRKDPPAG